MVLLATMDCPNCADPFTEEDGNNYPLLLPCQHPCCYTCMVILFKDTTKKGSCTQTCPYCSYSWTMKNVLDLPKDTKRIEEIASKRRESGEKTTTTTNSNIQSISAAVSAPTGTTSRNFSTTATTTTSSNSSSSGATTVLSLSSSSSSSKIMPSTIGSDGAGAGGTPTTTNTTTTTSASNRTNNDISSNEKMAAFTTTPSSLANTQSSSSSCLLLPPLTTVLPISSNSTATTTTTTTPHNNSKTTTKACPTCQLPWLKPRGHSTHHIRGCVNCGAHYCYACCSSYAYAGTSISSGLITGGNRCRNGCSLYCSPSCDCTDCKDCQENQPCVNCDCDGRCWVCDPKGRHAIIDKTNNNHNSHNKNSDDDEAQHGTGAGSATFEKNAHLQQQQQQQLHGFHAVSESPSTKQTTSTIIATTAITSSTSATGSSSTLIPPVVVPSTAATTTATSSSGRTSCSIDVSIGMAPSSSKPATTTSTSVTTTSTSSSSSSSSSTNGSVILSSVVASTNAAAPAPTFVSSPSSLSSSTTGLPTGGALRIQSGPGSLTLSSPSSTPTALTTTTTSSSSTSSSLNSLAVARVVSPKTPTPQDIQRQQQEALSNVVHAICTKAPSSPKVKLGITFTNTISRYAACDCSHGPMCANNKNGNIKGNVSSSSRGIISSSTTMTTATGAGAGRAGGSSSSCPFRHRSGLGAVSPKDFAPYALSRDSISSIFDMLAQALRSSSPSVVPIGAVLRFGSSGNGGAGGGTTTSSSSSSLSSSSATTTPVSQINSPLYCPDWVTLRSDSNAQCCPRGSSCPFAHPHRRIVALTDCFECLQRQREEMMKILLASMPTGGIFQRGNEREQHNAIIKALKIWAGTDGGGGSSSGGDTGKKDYDGKKCTYTSGNPCALRHSKGHQVLVSHLSLPLATVAAGTTIAGASQLQLLQNGQFQVGTPGATDGGGILKMNVALFIHRHAEPTLCPEWTRGEKCPTGRGGTCSKLHPMQRGAWGEYIQEGPYGKLWL